MNSLFISVNKRLSLLKLNYVEETAPWLRVAFGKLWIFKASRVYIDLHLTRVWIENFPCGRANRLLKSSLGHTSRIPSYLFALKWRTNPCVDHTAVLKFLLRSTLWEELRSFRPNVYLSDGVSCGLKSISTVTCNSLIQACNRVNILFKDVILVKTVRHLRVQSLSFHAYRIYSIKRRRWKQNYQ